MAMCDPTTGLFKGFSIQSRGKTETKSSPHKAIKVYFLDRYLQELHIFFKQQTIVFALLVITKNTYFHI